MPGRRAAFPQPLLPTYQSHSVQCSPSILKHRRFAIRRQFGYTAHKLKSTLISKAPARSRPELRSLARLRRDNDPAVWKLGFCLCHARFIHSRNRHPGNYRHFGDPTHFHRDELFSCCHQRPEVGAEWNHLANRNRSLRRRLFRCGSQPSAGDFSVIPVATDTA